MEGTAEAQFLYWRFAMLGVASLVAWNVYIVSSDFFRWEFRDTPFQNNFESVFSILSNGVNLGALCYALYTQTKADHDRRIRNGLLATVAAFGAIFLLPVLGIGGWAALVLALLALCTASVAAAYVQCSILGIVALLPPYCAEGFMSGQAIAGTVASAVQLITVYANRSGQGSNLVEAATDERGPQLRLCAAAYFCISALFLALSTAAWRQLDGHLVRHHSSTVYEEAAVQSTDSIDEDSRQQPHTVYAAGLVDEATLGTGHPLGLVDPCGAPNGRAEGAVPPVLGSTGSRIAEWLASLGLQNAEEIWATVLETQPFVIICAVVMGQTLAVFPPLTEAIISAPRSTVQVAHITAWHFLIFNIGDYAGRVSTKWIRPTSARILHWVNHSRWLLVPALLLFPTAATPPQRTLLIHSDLLFLLLALVLGWTNGWVATSALILGPRGATNKELAGAVLGLALCLGLVGGALASYPILLIAGVS
ncbi:hypothetical protein GGF46_000101 [Coemansia sp. RSA 552]|nr:hypothetical protein GGF46_000101 [Coemansia sp. RSA 552]